jgi:type I restriction enzyme, S subunit
MSFPKYPKYKDSGVEWLGEVTEHWDFSPYGLPVKCKKRGGCKDRPNDHATFGRACKVRNGAIS